MQITHNNQVCFDPEALTITITGKSHIGKTHLALAIAKALKERYDFDIRNFDTDSSKDSIAAELTADPFDEIFQFFKEKKIAIDIVEDFVHRTQSDVVVRQFERRQAIYSGLSNTEREVAIKEATDALLKKANEGVEFDEDGIAHILRTLLNTSK